MPMETTGDDRCEPVQDEAERVPAIEWRLDRESLDRWLYQWTLQETSGRDFHARFGEDGTQRQLNDWISGHGLDRRMREEMSRPGLFRAIASPGFDTEGPHESATEPSDGEARQSVFQETGMFRRNRDVAICRHARYSPLFLHSHRFIEMTWVYRGACRQWLGAIEPEGCVQLAEGDLLILPPGERHAVGVFDDTLLLNILIRESTFDRFFLKFIPENSALSDFFATVLYASESFAPGASRAVVFHTGNDLELRTILQDTMLDICENGAFSNESVNLRMGLFFTLLLRHHVDSASFPGRQNKTMSAIPPMLRYMQDNQATVTLAGMAARFNYSPSWISRIFRTHVGASFVDTLSGIRMRTATELLLHSNLSVADIAAAVGYGDVTHFIRLFRRHSGTTPKQFRRTS